MTSRWTSKLNQRVLTIAFKLRVIHFHTLVIDEGKDPFRIQYVYESRRQFVQRVITVSLHTLFRVAFIGQGLWYDLTQPDFDVTARFTCYIIQMTTVMALFVLLVNNLFGRQLSDLSEMFVGMDEKLRAIHGLRAEERDGAEKYLEAMILVMGFVTVSVPLIGFQLVQWEVHMFGQYKTPYGLGAILFGLFGMFMIFINWLVVFIFVESAIMYVNSMLRLLKLLRWSPAMEAGKKDVFIFAYRMHQVMHISATQGSSSLIAFSISADAVLMIIILVLLVGFSSNLSWFLIFSFSCTFLTAMFATKLLLGMSTYLTDCSAEFPRSFLQNDEALTPVQKRALKTCHPLQLQIGPFSAISAETFPFLMSDIVMAEVADILVGLRTG